MRKTPSATQKKSSGDESIRLGHWTHLQPELLWTYHGTMPSWALDFPFDGDRETTVVWYLESGSLTLQYERETERYTAPGWIFPRHRPRRQQFSPGSRHLCIRFTLNWPDGTPLLLMDRTLRFRQGRFSKFDRASRNLSHFVQHQLSGVQLFVHERTGSLAMMAGLYTRFWSWIEEYLAVLRQWKISMSSRSTLDPRVAAALDALRRLPLAEPLLEKKLATVCGLSVAQMNRLFQQQLGMSPVKIRNNRRMSAACQGLLYSTENVKSLAYNLGFNSSQHFAYWFRKRTGKAPRDFRRTH
jgi:AraC-like DNA-binding protein